MSSMSHGMRLARDPRWWVAGVIGVVSVTVVIWTTQRAFSKHDAATAQREVLVNERRRVMDEGQSVYATIDATPLATFTTPAEVVQTFGSHLDLDPQSDGPADAANHVAELVYYRFLQESPSAYRSWMESRGYTLKPAAVIKPKDEYEFFLDEPYPGDEPTERVFDDLWRETLAAGDGRSRPVAIADEQRGFTVVTGDTDATGHHVPQLSGDLGEYWEGKQGVALARLWWADPNGGIVNFVREHGTVHVAVVGFVMEMKGGDRYPFSMSLYRDHHGDWWVWRINVHNVATDRLYQLEF